MVSGAATVARVLLGVVFVAQEIRHARAGIGGFAARSARISCEPNAVSP